MTKNAQFLRYDHFYLKHNPGLFQQIGSHASTNYVKLLVEINLDVFAKSGRVVISGCLGIANGLHDW